MELCGCFYCLLISPKQTMNHSPRRQLVCPHCGIDSLMSVKDSSKETVAVLREIRDQRFSGGRTAKEMEECENKK